MRRPSSKSAPSAGTTMQKSMFATLRDMWPYMWPSDRPDLKRRVVMALGVLVAAKLITVLVPYTYKWATDALTKPPAAGSDGSLTVGLAVLLTVPIMLVVANGVGRVLMNLFNNLRDALFARVGQHAVRNLAYKTFVHMHELSLRYHLQRRTGGLSRIIERGINGIEIIVRFTILNTLPTFFEFGFAAVIITYQFDWKYLAVVTVTVILYVWFTVRASNWRIQIRRTMNESDQDAHSKAIDSLLNFETVKYFGNEKMEAGRYDGAMARYEKAAVRIWTSLAWLNIGQVVIFTTGMTICMVMSGIAVMRGEQTIGDFVLINALLAQLAIPLNFIGTVYREIKQGLIDIEAMFDLLKVPPEIVDRPGAKTLAVDGGAVRFEDVAFHYDASRPILKGVSFAVPPGKTVAIVGPSGAGKSTISRLLFRFYEVTSGRITIDGQDVRDVTQESLRGAIGMVPQDTVLFNDTIAYNIHYGRPDATEEEVRAAAEIGADRRFHRQPRGRLRHRGRRARAETLRRREAARRHRPHGPQRPADPHPRRGHLGARYPHRAGNPGGARSRLARPHDAGHRPSPVDHRQRRRDHRSGRRRDRRARCPSRASRRERPLRLDVEPPAPGDRGRRGAARRQGGGGDRPPQAARHRCRGRTGAVGGFGNAPAVSVPSPLVGEGRGGQAQATIAASASFPRRPFRAF